jgi:site-specific recombinase XerD
MTKVKFYLDSRGLGDKKPAPLKVKITSKGVGAYIPLDVRILPSQWNDGREKIVSHPQEKSLNLYIRKKLLEVEEIVRELPEGMTGKQMVERVKIMLNTDSEQYKNENLFESVYVQYTNSRRAKRTRELYEYTLKLMRDFDKSLQLKAFEEITLDWLIRFDNYLSKSQSVNTRAIQLRNIKAVFNYAIKNLEICTCYPFHKFTIKETETPKRSLESEQLRKLFTLQLPETTKHRVDRKKQKVLDIFRLSFYLRGIRPVDLVHLKKKDVINNRVEYIARKGGSHYSIYLEPEAWAIINKYKGKGDYLLDILDNCKTDEGFRNFFGKSNKVIKELLPDFPPLSAYWARHSWATLAIELGYSMETVSMGLGHLHGEKVTLVYVAFRQKAVDECNRALIDYVLGKKKGRKK